VIALSRLESWAIVGVLILAFLIWLYALMKTSKQADAFMDQRWLEKQWLKEFSEAGVATGLAAGDRNETGSIPAGADTSAGVAPASELYDQDDFDG
jgi:hypothetical protein